MKIQDLYAEHSVLPVDWAKRVAEAVRAATPIAIEKTAALLSVPFGDHVYSFPATSVGGSDSRIGWSTAAKEALEHAGIPFTPGSMPIAATVQGVDLPCSVYLVTGVGGTGKTPLAYALAEAITADDPAGFGLLRFGEPAGLGYLKTNDEAGFELASLVAHHRAVVIDSIKDLLADMDGAATKSGISRRSFVFLSRLAMVATELGVVLILPINASSKSAEVIEMMAEMARSNVGVAVLAQEDQSWSLLARAGEGRERKSATVKLENVRGIPTLKLMSSETVTEAEVEHLINTFSSNVNPTMEHFLSAARQITNSSSK